MRSDGANTAAAMVKSAAGQLLASIDPDARLRVPSFKALKLRCVGLWACVRVGSSSF